MSRRWEFTEKVNYWGFTALTIWFFALHRIREAFLFMASTFESYKCDLICNSVSYKLPCGRQIDVQNGMSYTSFLISKFANKCIEKEHHQCNRSAVMKNIKSMGHCKWQQTMSQRWLENFLEDFRPNYGKPKVFPASPLVDGGFQLQLIRYISRKACVGGNRIRYYRTFQWNRLAEVKNRINTLLVLTTICCFFFSVKYPGHSGEERTLHWLIQQKKTLSPQKPVSQHEFLPYLSLLWLRIVLWHSWGCSRCRVCEKSTQGAQIYLGFWEIQSHGTDSVLSFARATKGEDERQTVRAQAEGSQRTTAMAREPGVSDDWKQSRPKQNVCFVSTLSKNCQAGLQNLWTNTSKINLVTKGCGHSWQRREGVGGNYKKEREREGTRNIGLFFFLCSECHKAWIISIIALVVHTECLDNLHM